MKRDSNTGVAFNHRGVDTPAADPKIGFEVSSTAGFPDTVPLRRCYIFATRQEFVAAPIGYTLVIFQPPRSGLLLRRFGGVSDTTIKRWMELCVPSHK